MSHAGPVTRVCGSCRRTRPSGCSPGAFCGPCKRALFDRQHLADPDARDDLATWVWDTALMRDALARLDFAAVLVIYRWAARLSRREMGKRTSVSKSAISYWEARGRQGICGILQLQTAVTMLALLAVLAGGPDGAALAVGAEGADRG